MQQETFILPTTVTIEFVRCHPQELSPQLRATEMVATPATEDQQFFASIFISGGADYGAYLVGLAVDGAGNIYIPDSTNNRIRLVTVDGKINTIAGNGSGNVSVANTPALNAGIPDSAGVTLGTAGKIYASLQLAGIVELLTPSATTVVPLPSIEPGTENDGSNVVTSATDFGRFRELALGSYIEIHGSYLAPDSRSWASSDFSGTNAPTSLDGTSVAIGGQRCFISYVSPGQINALVPSNIGTGVQPLVVTTTAGSSATYLATVNGVQPGLLAPALLNIKSAQYVAALFSDGSYVLPAGAIIGLASRPAKAGDEITLYGIGFGPVSPTLSAGQIAQGGTSLTSPLTVTVGFQGIAATILYAGFAPGQVGLYQFNIIVPKLSSTGPAPVNFTLGGQRGPENLYISTQ